jgi:hypothetical protein
MLRRLAGIMLGATTYVFLSWIIIIGPFISGFMSGLVAGGGGRRGFTTGLFSAIAGFIIIVALMNAAGLEVNGIIAILLYWVFILTNLVGFLLSACGGALGAMIAGQPKANKRPKHEDIFPESPTEVYVICPACGHSNREQDESCRHCGTHILG